MRYWQEIINRATLGSAKMPFKAIDMPPFVADEVELSDTTDVEEDFLRFSSLTYQYRQVGAVPLNLQVAVKTEAEDENKTYCSSRAVGVLKSILSEEHFALLKLWLLQCQAHGQLVEPAIIPELIEVAVNKKELRKLIREVSGKRGEWLCQLNAQWNFYTATTDMNTLWQTGTPDERKELLKTLRQENPTKAIELLQTTWAEESANEKVIFLEILKVNLSEHDLHWLQSLMEKGQKVNSAVSELIKLIPSSQLVKLYQTILKEAINLKGGKALLGMINRTVLDVNEQLIFPDEIFKSGIEKLSSNKNISDNQFILIQLISSVPSSFWNTHLNTTPPAIIELIQKEKRTALYLPALAVAAIKFKDTIWIKALLDFGDEELLNSSLILLIRGLPQQQHELYAKRFMKDKPQEFVALLINHDQEWSVDLAKNILRFTANEVYVYNKTFYRQAVTLIPIALLNELESFTPSEDAKKTYWKNQQDELSRLLTLKQQTLQSFLQ